VTLPSIISFSCPAQCVAAQYAEGVGRDGWETEAAELEGARAKRAEKNAAQEAKGKRKRGRKSKSSPPEPEEDIAETARRGRKRKSAELEAPEPTNKMARMSNAPKPASPLVMQASRTQMADDEIAPEPWRAPVAHMY
jgi:hypothetical protein